RHPPVLIGGEHGIADAVERSGETGFALPQLVLSFLLLRQIARDLGEPTQPPPFIAKRSDDDVCPEAAAISPYTPALIFYSPFCQRDPQQSLRLATSDVL